MSDNLQKLGALAFALVAITVSGTSIYHGSQAQELTPNEHSASMVAFSQWNQTSSDGSSSSPGSDSDINNFSPAQAAGGVILPKDKHNFVTCDVGGSISVNTDDLGDILAWAYEFTGNEPPFDGEFWVSAGELAVNRQYGTLNTLQHYKEGRRYYIMADTDIRFQCGVEPTLAAECQNGTVESGEECDDGNNITNDECSTECTLPVLHIDQLDIGAGGTIPPESDTDIPLVRFQLRSEGGLSVIKALQFETEQGSLENAVSYNDLNGITLWIDNTGDGTPNAKWNTGLIDGNTVKFSSNLPPNELLISMNQDETQVFEVRAPRVSALGQGTFQLKFAEENFAPSTTRSRDIDLEVVLNSVDSPAWTIAAVCGNGVVETDEACDDENPDTNDGCDNDCNIEPGYQCSGNPSNCSLLIPMLPGQGGSSSPGSSSPGSSNPSSSHPGSSSTSSSQPAQVGCTYDPVDGRDDFFAQGTATFNGQSQIDICNSDTELLEYNCSFGFMEGVRIDCNAQQGRVCRNGACVANGIPDNQTDCLANDSYFWDQETDSCKTDRQVCTDPDTANGFQIGVAGQTFGFRRINGGPVDARIRTGGSDTCVDDSTVLEHRCSDIYFIESENFDCPDTHECSNGACVEKAADPIADLDVTIEASKTEVTPNRSEKITYVIVVTNDGTAPATPLYLTNTIPDGLELVPNTEPGSSTDSRCRKDPGSRYVYCNEFGLNAGREIRFRIQYKILNPSACGVGQLKNTADVRETSKTGHIIERSNEVAVNVVCNSTSAACNDSDGGFEPLMRGTTTFNGRDNHDFCQPTVSDSTLYEYSCLHGGLRGRRYDCAPAGNICSNGACVPPPLSDGPAQVTDIFDANTDTPADPNNTATIPRVPSGDKSAIGLFKFVTEANRDTFNLDSIVFTVNAQNVALDPSTFKIFNKNDDTDGRKVSCSPHYSTGEPFGAPSTAGNMLLLVRCILTGNSPQIYTSITAGNDATFVLEVNVTNPGSSSSLQVGLSSFSNDSAGHVFDANGNFVPNGNHIKWSSKDASGTVTPYEFLTLSNGNPPVNSTYYQVP